MTATPDQTALTRSGGKVPSGQSLMVRAAREAGVSPLRQMVQIMRLRRAPCHLTAREYFDFQLYRPSLDSAARQEFVGEEGNYLLNLRLAPPVLTGMRGFLGDKLALTTLFAAWGLPTTRLRAVFAPVRRVGSLPVLRDAQEVASWLRGQEDFPIFGKPARGAQAQGSVRIDALDRAADTVTLGNGRTVAIEALAAEVARHGKTDYLFQDAVVQHPEISELIGARTVSTLRLVTVVEDNAPRLLYAVWKLGSPRAMSDNFWQEGSLISLLDPASGEVLRCRLGSGLGTQWLEKHPETGAQILGRRVPNFDKAVALALEVHGAFPASGLLGWDIALTEDGACLIECNENTGHALYQYAADRGVLNADFKPVFERIAACNKAEQDDLDRRNRAYLRARARF